MVLGVMLGPRGAAATEPRGVVAYHDRGPVGFHRVALTRDVEAGLDHPTERGPPTLHLEAGTRLELLMAPPHLEGRPWALTADGTVVWVPADAVRMVPEASLLTREALRRRAGAEVREAPYCLAPGVYHREIRWRSTRLQLVELSMDENPHLELAPAVSEFFRDQRGRGVRTAPVKDFSSQNRALLAANGTFFSTGSKNWGTPLGAMVTRGEILTDGEEPDVLLRTRSYLAWTSHGRFVTGELEGPLREFLARGTSPELAPGERVVSLVGGLGRLARRGDADAWREIFRRQFPSSYYSRHTRRAQLLFGMDGRGRTLYVLAQEGYPHSKHRFTLPELGHLLVGLGAEDVLFGDGGRSTDLVLLGTELVKGELNKPKRPVSSAVLIRERSD